jgi:hypothetical protein
MPLPVDVKGKGIFISGVKADIYRYRVFAWLAGDLTGVHREFG